LFEEENVAMITNLHPSVLGKASELGVSLFEETAPVQLLPGASPEEVEVVIRAAYRQVLGNAHVMESDRLPVPESRLRDGDITVREFARQVAQSELYRNRFFDNCPRLRFIELNFKHLLGRTPESHEELSLHSQILDLGSYWFEIDSYLDRDEYRDAFGENIVPYYRGYRTQAGRKVVGFTHLFQLLRGACNSDLNHSGERPRLQRSLLTNQPSAILPLSVPPPVPPVRLPQPVTDAGQLIAKTLGLKTYPSVSYQESSARTYSNPLGHQYRAFEEVTPIELLPGRSESEVETAIRAAYRQVLGNAHVMESERLTVPESQLKRGEISVREFVRQLANSELYRSRFFDNCPRYRSIELNFKHLLGRAPDDYSETFSHSQILDAGGFEAEIDSYLDSDEYQDAFGENIVPYYRGYRTQTGKKLLGFYNTFELNKSLPTSDKAGVEGNRPRLAKPLIYNNPLGMAPITDIQKLLAEVLKPKPSAERTPLQLRQAISESALQRQEREQAGLLEALQKQLAELQPFAALGEKELSKWQSVGLTLQGGPTPPSPSASTSPPPAQSLEQRIREQAQEIADLQAKIADSRRLAAIGEARLNKWRSRMFSR
jgi:phycobilisome core-membrane linker protein